MDKVRQLRPSTFIIRVMSNGRRIKSTITDEHIIKTRPISIENWGCPLNEDWKKLNAAPGFNPSMESYRNHLKFPTLYIRSLLFYLSSEYPFNMNHWQRGNRFSLSHGSETAEFELQEWTWGSAILPFGAIGRGELDLNSFLYDILFHSQSREIMGDRVLHPDTRSTILQIVQMERERIFVDRKY